MRPFAATSSNGRNAQLLTFAKSQGAKPTMSRDRPFAAIGDQCGESLVMGGTNCFTQENSLELSHCMLEK